MQISYDYHIFLDEIKDAIGLGALNLVSTIQILRDADDIGGGYYPIIAWYYSDEDMEDFNNFDVIEQTIYKKYVSYKPFLKNARVTDVLMEMQQKSVLFKY